MGTRLIVSSTIFLSLLLVFLNIFDLWFLSFNVIGLNISVFHILSAIVIGIVFYINAKKLNSFQFKTFLFLCSYFLLQLSNSLFSNGILLGSFSVFIMIIFALYITLSLRNYDNYVLYTILFLVTKYTIFLMIFFDLINHIIGGNSLFQIFQNNAPILLMSLIILHFYSQNTKQKKFLFRLFLFYIIWTAISYGLGNAYLRVQYKSVILLALVILGLFFIIKFKSIIPFFNKRFSLRYALPILFILMVVGLFAIASHVYDLIIEFIPRHSSGEIRIAVAEVMFSDATKNIFRVMFGQGLGSSNQTYLINNGELVSPHSGLIILFYEQGMLGLIFFLFFGLSFFIRKRIYIFNFKYKRGQAFFFLLLLVLLWIVQNIVYIIGFPDSNVYYQTQIILYILLATFLSNQLFIPKEKF